MRPYRTCAASSSPFTSLSRTAAHDASLDGVILMPYFLSNSMTEAITTDEQSVSGMKPIFTSFFSGASEPAAQAACRTAAGTRLMTTAAPVCLRNFRRTELSFGLLRSSFPSIVFSAPRNSGNKKRVLGRSILRAACEHPRFRCEPPLARTRSLLPQLACQPDYGRHDHQQGTGYMRNNG